MSPAALSTSVLTSAPGHDVGCDVQVTNPGAGELALDVRVEGPAAPWALVLPPALVLAPGASGRARITFAVPRGCVAAGSSVPFAVRVTGGAPVALDGRIEIAEVHELRVSVRPLVARARATTSYTVTVENRGTGAVRAALMAHGTSGDVALRLLETHVDLAPGEQAPVRVDVAPRHRRVAGGVRPHPFTVEARLETGPPVTAQATLFQDPLRWRRGAAALALALAAGVAGSLLLRDNRASAGRPLAVAAAAPLSTVEPAPACTARGAAPPVVDIAGFAYCPGALTVAAGTDVVWTNADLAPHTVTYTGPDGPVDSGSMAKGQSWSARFGQPGAYQYYCRFHPGMTGTIVVASS